MMKAIGVSLFSVMIALAAQAAKMPRTAFKASEYAEAVSKAKETGKPIAVVVTELDSTCPKCQAGTVAVFKKMRSDYVLVVKDEDDKLPADVAQKTYQIYKTKGNFIPIVTVLSAGDQQVLGGLCYDQIAKGERQAFKDLDEEVEKALANAPAPEKTEPAAAETAEEEGTAFRNWTNASGKTIRAEVLEVTELNVAFKLENGKVIDYPLAKLSSESRERLQEYQ